MEGLEQARNVVGDSVDHALVGFLRTAVEISKISKATARLPQALRLHLVTGGLPRPVRSVEVQAEQEGLAGLCILVHHFDWAIAKQTGQLTHLMDANVIIPEIFVVPSIRVAEIVHRSAAKSVEMIVATLERTKLRQNALMPFSDQGRAVAGLFEQRGQSRVFRRKSDIGVAYQSPPHPN